MKKVFIVLFMVFMLFSCNGTENKKIDDKIEVNKKIQITTSIIPLASIANYIWWDFVESKALVPSGVSPHSFDLKPKQIIDIEKSDLIVYLNIEHIDWFLDKAIEWKKNVLAVKEGIKILESVAHNHEEHSDKEEHHEEHSEKEEHHEKETHSIDPHIWGNSENASIIANKILNELIKISPENKVSFEKNLESFKNELDLIKKSFEEEIKGKKQNNFIVFHDAYNYLFNELNIDNSKKHIFRKNMLNDPNSSQMKELIDEIWELGIKVAFKEPQLDASNLKNLASEYNLEIFVLNPLGEDYSAKWYIENYKNNLKSLLNIYE